MWTSAVKIECSMADLLNMLSLETDSHGKIVLRKTVERLTSMQICKIF
jgi:hypothetical protein